MGVFLFFVGVFFVFGLGGGLASPQEELLSGASSFACPQEEFLSGAPKLDSGEGRDPGLWDFFLFFVG